MYPALLCFLAASLSLPLSSMLPYRTMVEGMYVGPLELKDVPGAHNKPRNISRFFRLDLAILELY